MRSTGSSQIRPRDPLARFEQDAGTRFLDLRVVVGRQKTKEILFAVGGRWDRAGGRYLDEPAERAKVVWLNEAQCIGEEGNDLEDGPAYEIKNWIEKRRAGVERLGEIVLDGARGSGKTFLGTLASFLIAIEFPGARCLLVPPANTRRHEIDVIVKAIVPRQWRAWNMRDMTYTMPNGSTVTYVGADDEDALKQGGYEVALLNEAQLMTSQAYVNATAGIRNLSGRPMGLLMLAMNYASKERGEWTNDHLDKIDGGLRGAKHHKLDPALNEFIDENANDIAEGLARSVRPDLADIDYSGIRKLLGNMAAPMFKPAAVAFGGHIGKPPTDLPNVTREVTAFKTGTKGFERVVGMDFQRRPGCVAVVFQLFRQTDGTLLYWAEKYIDAPGGYEDDIARRVEDYLSTIGLTARDALVVADSTGRHQDGTHKNAKPSHQILREWYYTVVAPQRQKKSGGWGIGNPDVDDSVAQFNCILMANGFLVSSDADPNEFLITSLRKCKTKKRGGSIRLDDREPGYSHPVDCCRYVTWYFEPKRGPAAPPENGSETFNALSKISLFGQQ